MTQSHWHVTSPTSSLALYELLPRTADVVVVGGGILGTSTAYWLARNGVRVVLLEQTSLAAGATGRNGGFLTVGAATSYAHAIRTWGHDTARAIWQLTYTNRDLMHSVIEEENIACDYRESGTAHISLNEVEMQPMREDVARLNVDGFAHETLDRAQLRECIHTSLSDEIVGGSLLLRGGLLHSAKLVAGIAHAAQRQGAVLCRVCVTHIEARGGSSLIQTDAGPINTNGLVLAANAWTSELVPGMRDFIVPIRGQMVSFAPIAPVFAVGLGAAVTDTEEYWQQTPDGAIVLGGCRSVHPARDENTLDDAVTDDVQGALETVLPRLFPSLTGRLHVARRWSGPMAFTPDRLPVFDRVPDLPNAWFAGGFCGHGMPFGMVFGQALAKAVVEGGRQMGLEMFAFSASRLRIVR